MSNLNQRLTDASAALDSGDARKAFLALRPVFDYPAEVSPGSSDWRKALEVFIAIVEAISGPKLGAKLRDTENQHAQAWYDAGYELIEAGLDGIAATFLSQANVMAPGQEGIVSELVTALENAGRNDEARRVLEAAPPALLEKSFLCSYLLAFDTLATGDVTLADQRWQALKPQDDTQRWMRDNVGQMLARAHGVITSVRQHRLSDTDLRGWHFVMNGSFLLHISPFGFDEGMRGRYAFTQDGAPRVKEGLEKLVALFAAVEMKPERVLTLPDRSSRIVSLALAERLSVPLVDWSEMPNAPGVIAAYDLQDTGLEGSTLRGLQAHTVGQALFSHAACWTQPFPLASDVMTFLHQFNVAPWAERSGFDAEKHAPIKHPADTRDAKVIAREILDAALEADALADLADIQTLAGVARVLPESAQPALLRPTGRRNKMLADSPVKSSRFA